jgi:hypothetical protein
MFSAGRAHLAIGRVRLTSEIVRKSDPFTYVALHMGDHHVNCGVRHAGAIPAYEAMAQEMQNAFNQADFPGLIRLIDRHFGDYQFTLKNLFRDEQRKILRQVLAAVQDDVQNTYRLITDRHAALMRFLAGIHSPPLKSLEVAEEIVLNADLGRQFENSHFDAERVRTLLAECRANNVNLDCDTLGYAAKGFLERLSDQFAREPNNRDLLQQLVNVTDVVSKLPFKVNLWKPQNEFYLMSTTALPEAQKKAETGDVEARAWVRDFCEVGLKLGFKDPAHKN